MTRGHADCPVVLRHDREEDPEQPLPPQDGDGLLQERVCVPDLALSLVLEVQLHDPQPDHPPLTAVQEVVSLTHVLLLQRYPEEQDPQFLEPEAPGCRVSTPTLHVPLHPGGPQVLVTVPHLPEQLTFIVQETVPEHFPLEPPEQLPLEQ